MKNAALATSVYRRATCCNAEPKKSDNPIKKERIANVLKSNLNSDLNFFTSNKNTRGTIARNPTKECDNFIFKLIPGSKDEIKKIAESGIY